MKKSIPIENMEKMEEKQSSYQTKDAAKSTSSLKKVYLAFFSAHLYTIGMGLVACYPAPATVDMRKKGSRFINITPDEITWIASWPVLTCGMGCLMSGYLCQKLGRRSVLILSSTPYVLGWLMVAYAPSIVWIYVGRMITGFCMGICTVGTTAYVPEISPIHIRGMLGSGFQLFFSLGALLVLVQAYVLRWSWLAVTSAGLVVTGACFMYFMPESPEWLYRNATKREAALSLSFFKGRHVNIEKELAILAENNQLEDQPSKGGITWRDFLEPTLYKPTLISMALLFFQQTCGINVLNSYVVEIFQNTGSSIDAQSSAVLFAGVQVLATLVSSALLDRTGRRCLFITSGAIVTLSLIVLGMHNFLPTRGYDVSQVHWIPLASLLAFICFYAIGFGPIPLTMAPELVPVSSRSAVLSISITFSTLVAFAVTKLFDVMVTHLNYYGLFWTYSVFSLFGTLFGIFILPETKGKSVSDINKSFSASSRK